MSKTPNSCRVCLGPCDYRREICHRCYWATRIAKPAIERLLEKVFIDANGCWLFTGFCLPNGYGRIQGVNRSDGPMLAHRVSWIVHYGAIPTGLLVCHKCDIPSCVNPAHLFLGTHSDNSQDMHRKGRYKAPKEKVKLRGSGNPQAKFTEMQIREMFARRGESRQALATEFGTTARYISSVVCGHKWQHLKLLREAA